jgi:hypothetical protein
VLLTGWFLTANVGDAVVWSCAVERLCGEAADKRRKENSEVLKGLYWNDVSPELSIVIIEVLASASRRVHWTTGQAKDALLYCALLKYHKIEFFIYFMH